MTSPLAPRLRRRGGGSDVRRVQVFQPWTISALWTASPLTDAAAEVPLLGCLP